MAEVKRIAPKFVGKDNVKKPEVKPAGPRKVYVLPTTKVKPISSLSDAVSLIYGETKIGKSALAAMFPDQIFFFTERGGRGMERYEVFIDTWADFVGYVNALKNADEKQFKTVTLDTFDKLYDKCLAHVCADMGIDDPTEEGYGKGWRAVKAAFEKEIDKLVSVGIGVVMISHATEKKFESRNGADYDKIVPSASKQATKLALAMADITLYMGYFGEDRHMVLAGSDEAEAGTRLQGNFWVKGSNPPQRVYSIPSGKSPEEAWKNLNKAFRNEQETEGRPKGRTGLTDKQAPMGKKK